MASKTDKVVISKAVGWLKNPMYVSGAYRLFTYVKWENLPEEYKKFYPADAAAMWNDDLENFKHKNIMLDIESEIKAVYRELIDKNLVHAMGLVPIIIADMFMLDKHHMKVEVKLNKVISTYIEDLKHDRDMAEVAAAYAVVEVLEFIVKKLNLSSRVLVEPLMSYVDSAYSKIISQIDLRLSKEPKITKGPVSSEVLESVDKALEDYTRLGEADVRKKNI